VSAIQAGQVPDQGSGLMQFARRAAAPLGGQPRSPSEVLRDLRLPAEAIAILRSALQGLDLQIQETEIAPRFGSKRLVTALSGQPDGCLLLHIPGWILDNPTPQKDDALTSLPYALSGKARLFLVSVGLDIIPARVYRRLITEIWRQQARVEVNWVPWMDILALGEPGVSPDELQDQVVDIFGLQPAAETSPGQVEVSDVDMSKLRRALVERFSDGDLRDLCFDLEIDYESLPGDGKADKARELLILMRQHRRIGELLPFAQKLRPDIQWEDLTEE